MSTKKLKVHFIGIGGIGVSALARYYLEKGHKVSGSDLVSSEITDALKKEDAQITIGKNTIKGGVDLIIYSLAVPELYRRAHNVMSYPEALGELTRQHYTIAVSGTHGKSTTTAMIGLILVKAGFDPTVIVGTKLKEFGNSNCRVGKSRYLLLEADEHFASFLNYRPKVIVVTNVDKEHLDFYKNFENVKKAFKKFIGLLPKDGILITGKSIQRKDVRKLKRILKIPGGHNAYNAALALNAARALKIPDKVSLKALSEYHGSWRRFEITKTLYPKPLTLISDYAHHPTEIKATLKAAREKYPKKKIWCVFQPHQYQRTYYLFDDFVKVFREAPIDRLVITDIYDVAGREEEKIKEKVNSEKLVKAINKDFSIYLPNDRIMKYLKKELQGVAEADASSPTLRSARVKDVVLIMGAGDIYKIWKEF